MGRAPSPVCWPESRAGVRAKLGDRQAHMGVPGMVCSPPGSLQAGQRVRDQVLGTMGPAGVPGESEPPLVPAGTALGRRSP